MPLKEVSHMFSKPRTGSIASSTSLQYSLFPLLPFFQKTRKVDSCSYLKLSRSRICAGDFQEDTCIASRANLAGHLNLHLSDDLCFAVGLHESVCEKNDRRNTSLQHANLAILVGPIILR